MGTTVQKCCALSSEKDSDHKSKMKEEKKRLLHKYKNVKAQQNIINEVPNNSVEIICNKLEKLIQLDPSQRGIKNIHIPGQLYKALISLINAKHVIIATGFPCCITSPHTESDGPSGGLILAYSLLNHDKNRKVTLMIDPIHNKSIEPLVKYFNDTVKLQNKNKLELYVCDTDMDFDTDFTANEQFEDVDVMIAIELAGNTSDGTFRTMSGRDISDKCGKTAVLFDYIGKNRKDDIITIGVGDGGNECGMGNVVDNVRKYIKNGDKIACVVKANYLITTGVSNWAAEALAAGLGTYCDDTLHEMIYLKMSEFGCRDGITEQDNGSVDGLPYSQHKRMYNDLCDIYKRNKSNLVLYCKGNKGGIKFGHCPFTQKVLICLNLHGLKYEMRFIDLNDKPQKFLDLNKKKDGYEHIMGDEWKGACPVLVDIKHKMRIFDSGEICNYLEDRYPPSVLSKNNPKMSEISGGLSLFDDLIALIKDVRSRNNGIIDIKNVDNKLLNKYIKSLTDLDRYFYINLYSENNDKTDIYLNGTNKISLCDIELISKLNFCIIHSEYSLGINIINNKSSYIHIAKYMHFISEQEWFINSNYRQIIFEEKKKEKEEKEEKEEYYLPLPGKCMIKRTFDLNRDLLTLKKKYNNKYKELLPRSWQIINDIDIQNDNDIDIISIMQFNMLADGLSDAYSLIETEKSFLGVDKQCLQWTYRGLRICEEITRFDPDIICIQECDQIQFLLQYLGRFGYDSYSQQSSDTIQKIAKKLSVERKKDIFMANCTISILFKSTKFRINGEIQKIDKTKNEEKVCGLAIPLKCKNNDNEFLVITTHLKSTKTEYGEKIREKQINLLLNKLIKNNNNLPIILCCDLNGNPIKNKNGYDPLCYNSIINNIGYKSIYRLANLIINNNDNEPEYTTWKYRKHGTDKHTIDYIFVNNQNIWDIIAILQIPKNVSIPSWKYPSDHFSIMTKLKWRRNNN